MAPELEVVSSKTGRVGRVLPETRQKVSEGTNPANSDPAPSDSDTADVTKAIAPSSEVLREKPWPTQLQLVSSSRPAEEPAGGTPGSAATVLEPPPAPEQTPVPAVPPLPAMAAQGPAAVYVLGQVVLCKQPNPLAPYHTRGWHKPEPEFTWIDGVEGEIELLLRRPSVSCYLHMQLNPHLVKGLPQTVEIFFNYFRLGRYEIPRPMDLTVELPPELFILRKTRINLHCPDAARPADFGSQDTRRLGIALARWSIA